MLVPDCPASLNPLAQSAALLLHSICFLPFGLARRCTSRVWGDCGGRPSNELQKVDGALLVLADANALPALPGALCGRHRSGQAHRGCQQLSAQKPLASWPPPNPPPPPCEALTHPETLCSRLGFLAASFVLLGLSTPEGPVKSLIIVPSPPPPFAASGQFCSNRRSINQEAAICRVDQRPFPLRLGCCIFPTTG
jgi:hypothetical protein